MNVQLQCQQRSARAIRVIGTQPSVPESNYRGSIPELQVWQMQIGVALKDLLDVDGLGFPLEKSRTGVECDDCSSERSPEDLVNFALCRLFFRLLSFTITLFQCKNSVHAWRRVMHRIPV